MTRMRAMLYAILPLKYAGYVAVFLAVLWYGVKWLFVLGLQALLWSGVDFCKVGTFEAESQCALVRDNQFLLYFGFVVLAVGTLALCAWRYMAARRAPSNPGLGWPWG